jgi:enolase
MTEIRTLRGREILDSRGRPTVEAELELVNGIRVHASVPSGASTGRHEAHELRDGDLTRYGGLGVKRAVENVGGELATAIVGRDAGDQRALDEALIAADGTPDKSRLGANGVLAASLAAARAAAIDLGIPLWRHLTREAPPQMPRPMVNLISGGLHARRNLDLQDFLIIPVGVTDYPEALEVCSAVIRSTGELLKRRGLSTLHADEGGFGPELRANQEALELAAAAVEHAGLALGTDIAFALDVAASHFFDSQRGVYELLVEDRTLPAEGVIELLEGWIDAFPIVSIEDALAEDDWDGWRVATDRLGGRVQLVGDDLFTTNRARLEHGLQRGVANAVLVKMNQIGSLTETLDLSDQAAANGYQAIISARSGETEDDALADLAVASGAGQIKVGSLTQSERLAKYNRLLRILDELEPANRRLAPWSVT